MKKFSDFCKEIHGIRDWALSQIACSFRVRYTKQKSKFMLDYAKASPPDFVQGR